MEKNAEQRNVLQELLQGAVEEPGPGEDDLRKLLYRDPKETVSGHRSFRLSDTGPRAMPIDPEDFKGREDDSIEMYQSFRLALPLSKKKATIYFPKKLHMRLKSTKHQLKKLVPEELSSRVTMSDIVTLALRIVLQEFENKGDKSLLLKFMVKNLERKADK